MSGYINRDIKFRLSLTGSSNGCDRDGGGLLSQRKQNKMLIADYCPAEGRVRPSCHGLRSRGFVRQESTPSRPSEKTFQAVQVRFIQETPPSRGCVQHSCKSGGPSNLVQGLTGLSTKP